MKDIKRYNFRMQSECAEGLLISWLEQVINQNKIYVDKRKGGDDE